MVRASWISALTLCWLISGQVTAAEEAWIQYQLDAGHSGNAADRDVTLPLRLVGTVALGDAVLSAPVVSADAIYVIDGSATVYCIDRETLEVRWRFSPPGGQANVNHVSTPALCGDYLHFGTTGGWYYVLDRQTGQRVTSFACGDPIFSAPAVGSDRVYFATLGARVFAVTARGDRCWQWDFVKEVLGFDGDRWNGAEWLRFKKGRVTWRDHFCCSRNIAVYESRVVVPAGGRTVFLEDAGDHPKVLTVGVIPDYAGSEYAATFAQSIDGQGRVFVQWHRRDNAGRVEIMEWDGRQLKTSFVPGTQTAINLPGLLSFSPVSVRGDSVYRCRVEHGWGLVRHDLATGMTERLADSPSITPPVLLKNHAVYGALDGNLYVVNLTDTKQRWTFATAFGKPISAPPAVCDGQIIFGGEDGYLYVLGPKGNASLPRKSLALENIRHPLTGPYAAAEYDWYTNYGNLAATNASPLQVEPPVTLKWIRRYAGTFKHLPVCGGGRMYTHTAEGQIYAVEQESGRLLWRRYWPHVYLSFTSPIYYRHEGKERLLVPQAGMTQSRVRCLDAATGELIWEAPFTGSPSWSRQMPPVIHGNLAIYASGSGRYAAQGTERAFVMKGEPQPQADGREVMSWIYTHNNPYYPKDNEPHIWAWDLQTGELVWEKNFSDYGTGGNDCGLCLMDGTLYYSTFFGYDADQQKRRGLSAKSNGLTAALDPKTGRVLWLTTDYYVTAGCTISGDEGRLYLGGYNQPDARTKDRFVFCLDARDGSLVWKSEPVRSAVNVITIARDFIFSNASGRDGHVIDKETGRIVSRFNFGYACTRFTCAGTCILGANMDVIDLARDNQLIATGPCIDSRECVGSTISNGRMFYTSQASGVQASLVYGSEAQGFQPPWCRVQPAGSR